MSSTSATTNGCLLDQAPQMPSGEARSLTANSHPVGRERPQHRTGCSARERCAGQLRRHPHAERCDVDARLAGAAQDHDGKGCGTDRRVGCEARRMLRPVSVAPGAFRARPATR